MEQKYLIDHLFDLLNESDILDLRAIERTPEKDGYIITAGDGSAFSVVCKALLPNVMQTEQ